MYQSITLVGRLGRDPEMRYTPAGKAVTSFSMAVDRGYGDKKTTIWFRVSAWEKLAEVCSKYLLKGQLVLIVGELSAPNTYEDKSGKWQASLEVTARTVQFLSKGKEEGKDYEEKDYEETEPIPF